MIMELISFLFFMLLFFLIAHGYANMGKHVHEKLERELNEALKKK